MLNTVTLPSLRKNWIECNPKLSGGKDMIDYRNSIIKNNELHRKKLLKESGAILREQAKINDSIFHRIIALSFSLLTSILSGLVLPNIINETGISLWWLFLIIPAIIISFIILYFIFYWIVKLVVFLKIKFTSAEHDNSNAALQDKIDLFDINITSMVQMFYGSLEEYKTTTATGDLKFSEFLQVRYYLFKAITSLSTYTEEQNKEIISEKNGNYITTNYRSVHKIEKFRLENILRLTVQAKVEYLDLLKKENPPIDQQAELNYLNQKMETINDAVKYLKFAFKVT